MEKWTCCGIEIVKLCRRAGCRLPENCFFCGKARKIEPADIRPEDPLAFELAEIWCEKIRVWHGDPESHAPSFDQYGRADIKAWRAVARRVLERFHV